MLIDLHIRDDILQHFPNYNYLNCTEPERLDFKLADNLVGDQQEAFILYNILKQITEHKDVGMCGLDIGCGQGAHFACIGINDYYGEDHPIYHGKYIPHITSLAETIDTIFNQETFSFIVASHILEHVNNPITTYRKWCKLLRKEGVIILLIPDARYEIQRWDITHKNFYTPEDFEKNMIILNQDIIKTEAFNDLNNKFSLNYVGRRI